MLERIGGPALIFGLLHVARLHDHERLVMATLALDHVLLEHAK
jgi:hypothetical protein